MKKFILFSLLCFSINSWATPYDDCINNQGLGNAYGNCDKAAMSNAQCCWNKYGSTVAPEKPLTRNICSPCDTAYKLCMDNMAHGRAFGQCKPNGTTCTGKYCQCCDHNKTECMKNKGC